MKFKLSGFLLLFVFIAFGYRYYEPEKSLDELKEKYTNSHSAFIKLGEQLIHYQKYGNKEPVLILLHGTGSSLHTWEPWAKSLEDSLTIYTIDLPGYGLTGPSVDNKYHGEAYAQVISSFMQELEIDSCILGGNSLGGFVAWNTALDFPEKIQALILVDPAGFQLNSKSVPVAFKLARVPLLNKLLTFFTPKSIIEASVKNVYYDPSKVTPDLVERFFDLSLREGNREAFVKRMQNEKFESRVDQIKEISCPTLILWGVEDQLIPVENAYKFEKALKNSTLVVLPKLGHVPMEEDPETSLIPVVSFINSLQNVD